MLRQLEHDSRKAASRQAAGIARLESEIELCDKQTDMLLDMRLNEQISQAEYTSKKSALVSGKAELRGKLEALRRNEQNRFEPTSCG